MIAKVEISVQKKGRTLTAVTDDDRQILAGFPDNILLIATLKGSRKQRSIHQNNLYRACTKIIANHCRETFEGDRVGTDREWDTKEKVHVQLMMATGWYERVCVLPDGTVIFEPKSTSFIDMSHMEACGVLDKALELGAFKIGYTKEQLIAEAKDNMG